MKAYISVLAVIFIAATIFSEIATSCPCQEEDAASDKNLAIAQCSEQHKISNEAFERIANHEDVPNDHEVKCWLSCIMKKLGMMKEGQIDWEHSKTLMKQDLASEKDKAKVDKIAEICLAQVSEEKIDECQLAYSVAVCKINNWNKLGLPKRKVEQ
ncbi:unnamed protein product [Nezara viridula]|uniref:Uncharacterized protein n=1 Tax=Nezara viridula TaxID=85310 RepID=A0A9P0H3X9_NEZVI|nr:unnamed protein product [Nezara viridula]